MAVYIWSDLHLHHANIIRYADRPFLSVQEMDQFILTAWRETVAEWDTVINLGDFAFRITKPRARAMLRELPGIKILLRGNHDTRRSVKWWREAGFDEVVNGPVLYRMQDDGTPLLLSHQPIEDHLLGGRFLNVHGHIHSWPEKDQRYRNVSVERIGYRPALLEAVLEPVAEQEAVR